MKKRKYMISLLFLPLCAFLLWIGKKGRKQYYPM